MLYSILIYADEIVDSDSYDEALDIAGSLPSLGTIFEVRPVKRIFS